MRRFWFFLLLLNFISCSQQSATPTSQTNPNYLYTQLFDENTNLDPHTTWEFEAIDIFNLIFDSLYLIKTDGTIVPGIADQLPTITNKGRTYRIALKKDLKFHDNKCFRDGKGRHVTADDVIYSFKRLADPNNDSGLWSLLRSRIEGLDDYHQGITTSVSGLKALSPYEIEITLTKPYSQFLSIMAMPSFAIVAPEAVKKYGRRFGQNPVGTGPFRIESYTPKQIILKRNPHHFRNPKSTLLPDGIVLKLFDDPWVAFKNNALDIHYLKSNRLFAFVDNNMQVKDELKKNHYHLLKVTSPSSLFIIFNHNKPALQNVYLRKAIAHAINWETLVSSENLVSASLIPQGILGYQKQKFRYDPVIAKKYLEMARASLKDPVSPLILRFRWKTRLKMAAMIADDLAAIGLATQLELKDLDELENADLGFQGWAMDYPDAEGILGLLKSNNQPPAGNNYGYYQNAQLDQALEQTYQLTETDSKTKLYQQINQSLYKNVAIIPFRQLVEFYALSPRVSHVVSDPLGYVKWEHIRLKEGSHYD